MGELELDGFDWDDGNRAKCQSHHLSIEQIKALLLGAPFVIDDVEHSAAEVRLKAVGRLHASPTGRSTSRQTDQRALYACQGDRPL